MLNFLAGLILTLNGASYVCKSGEVLNYVQLRGDDQTVALCTVRDSGPGLTAVAFFGNRGRVSHVVVERSGGAGVAAFSGTDNVIEDSVIRDPVRRPGQDAWGIFNVDGVNFIARRNTVYGSGFGVNPSKVSSSQVLDNRFVIPEDYRTNCTGNIQRDGKCQCAEFGIGIKGSNVLIRGNTISGYRQSDPICGGSGAPGAGISTSACAHPSETCPTDNIMIEGNTITESHDGLYVGLQTTNLRVVGNRFCRNDTGIQDGFSAPRVISDNDFNGNLVNALIYGPGAAATGSRVGSCE